MLLKTDAIIQPKYEIIRALASVLPDARFEAVREGLESDRRPESSALHGLEGVTVRFSRAHVIDSHARFDWEIAADVYPLIAVVSDGAEGPVEIRALGVFSEIDDATDLPTGSDWDVLRAFDRTPSFLDVHVILMRSRRGIRDTVAQLAAALDTAPAKALTAALGAAVTSAEPAARSTVAAAGALLGLVVSYLAKERDEQLFYGVASFEDDPDDLGIGRVWRLTNHVDARVDFEILPRCS
jgi:hypothetical protein